MKIMTGKCISGCLAAGLAVALSGVVWNQSTASAQNNNQPQTTVKVKGLRIVAESEHGDDLRAFNWTSGTSLAMQLEVPEGGLIAVDRNASTVDSFTDDKKTDLLKQKPNTFSNSGFGAFPKISSDGKVLLFEYSAPQVPAAGATQLTIKGTLVVQQATHTKTATQENIALKENTPVLEDPIHMAVSHVGKPEFGDGALQVTLKITKNAASISEIRFLDAAGKKIEAKTAGTMTYSMGAEKTVEKNYVFSEMYDTVTIEIEYWDDMKQSRIPFETTTALGFN